MLIQGITMSEVRERERESRVTIRSTTTFLWNTTVIRVVGLFSASIEINFHRCIRRKKRNFPNFLLSNPLGMFQLVVGSDEHGTFYRPFLPPSCPLCICIKHATTKLAFDRPSTYFVSIRNFKFPASRSLLFRVVKFGAKTSYKYRIGKIGSLVNKSREDRNFGGF